MHQCSFCKAFGHNKQTCLAAEISSCLLPAAEKKERKQSQCSTCGEQGHSSRKCLQNPSTTPQVKAPRHCKACGESGHNVRTCHALSGMLTICLPCSPSASPSASPTYKRTQTAATHTIQALHVPVEGNHEGLMWS